MITEPSKCTFPCKDLRIFTFDKTTGGLHRTYHEGITMTKILENETRVQGGEVNNLENLGRRKAVKTIACGVTVLAAYHILPTRWDRPIAESVFLPAHAATSSNTAPVGESFSVDAGYASTYSVDLTPHISDADGDTLTTTLVGSGVLFGDPVISVATIFAICKYCYNDRLWWRWKWIY